ncbi:MAG: hypothetical protein ACP5I1_01330 [Candidatus Hinthialibacter sp.]
MKKQSYDSRFLLTVLGLLLCVSANISLEAAPLTPGTYAPDDLTADPEPVTLVSVGTDDYIPETYRIETEETFNLEVYDLSPGVYQFVSDPAAKTDPAALNADINTVNISAMIGDSGAEGVLIRGTGSYPGETVISFGLINEYPELPLGQDGEIDLERAAGEIGYKFYTGRRCFNVDGVIAAFENVSIGDHANNNIGVVHTYAGGRTFMNDVWIYNVYDGVFFDDSAEGYFVNCILHQTYQPWNTVQEANEAGYFTEDWNTLVQPDGMSGTAYADGVGISEEDYPAIAGVILGNNVANGWNINLIETEGADPQYVYLKHCTLVRHQIRDTNRLWRHNTSGGEGAFVLIEDSMILSADIDPHAQIRIDTDYPDFWGSMFNTKFWNYAAGYTQLEGISYNNWNVDVNDPAYLDELKVDLDSPGGLEVDDASELFRIDGRKLTTFVENAVELTLASDGGPVGYRLPDTAPDGPLPVLTSGAVAVSNWPLY